MNSDGRSSKPFTDETHTSTCHHLTFKNVHNTTTFFGHSSILIGHIFRSSCTNRPCKCTPGTWEAGLRSNLISANNVSNPSARTISWCNTFASIQAKNPTNVPIVTGGSSNWAMSNNTQDYILVSTNLIKSLQILTMSQLLEVESLLLYHLMLIRKL